MILKSNGKKVWAINAFQLDWMKTSWTLMINQKNYQIEERLKTQSKR
jgi:hypothetical protein